MWINLGLQKLHFILFYQELQFFDFSLFFIEIPGEFESHKKNDNRQCFEYGKYHSGKLCPSGSRVIDLLQDEFIYKDQNDQYQCQCHPLQC